MITTYQAAANNTTGGKAIAAAGTAIEIFKIIIGAPVSAGNIYLFSITNPGGTSNTNLLSQITLPTFSATNVNPGLYVIDLSVNGVGVSSETGANLMIDQTMQVTVLWDYAKQGGGAE